MFLCFGPLWNRAGAWGVLTMQISTFISCLRNVTMLPILSQSAILTIVLLNISVLLDTNYNFGALQRFDRLGLSMAIP